MNNQDQLPHKSQQPVEVPEDDEEVLKQYCADLEKRGVKYQVTPVHRKELSKN